MNKEDVFQKMTWGTLLFTPSVGWRSMLVLIPLTQGQGFQWEGTHHPSGQSYSALPPSWYPKCSPGIQTHPFIVVGCSKKGGPNRCEGHVWRRRGIIKQMLLTQWLVTPHLSLTPSYPQSLQLGTCICSGLIRKQFKHVSSCFRCFSVIIFRFFRV